jgi:hypothetical protein
MVEGKMTMQDANRLIEFFYRKVTKEKNQQKKRPGIGLLP